MELRFFFNDTATTEIYTLSLHDALPISGEWVITISRRYTDAEGQFAGAVVVALGVENFLRLFGRIDIGEKGAIALSTPGGQLLGRHPFREQNLGRGFSQSPNRSEERRVGE